MNTTGRYWPGFIMNTTGRYWSWFIMNTTQLCYLQPNLSTVA
jgi:hypothetical protein